MDSFAFFAGCPVVFGSFDAPGIISINVRCLFKGAEVDEEFDLETDLEVTEVSLVTSLLALIALTSTSS